MCSIRLSEPLLKLRPRKDLVETLLHEMIHAYLFVTNNDKDREGHGPEFCKHMHRINHLTGANITVYHSFHDEVDEYRRHWWRCNGPCQHRKPYYGYVKRATNRAPSAHDYWWTEHQKTCGGTFIKVKEPENYSKKGKGKTKLGKDLISSTENKDKPQRSETQLLIPFSGKGYVLGKTSNLPSSGKFITDAINETPNLLRQDHSVKAVRPGSKAEVKFEYNGPSKNVLSNYFPIVSVANQKAFKNVNGSPLKTTTVDDITKTSVSTDSQGRVTSSKIPVRNPLKATGLTSVTASPAVSGHEDKRPCKRVKLEDKTVFDSFFIKREQLKNAGNHPICSSYPVSTIQNSSASSSQSKMVLCPVCQNEVLETQINEHLDCCLEADVIEVKS
ncbi:DNA-dependent metalloprotease SPRTN isoform X3 [Erinaceus europaeus]|nr:DNA-dependent metalloprotease SPRTN isoform X3 [Erinaceus europaeus]